MFLTEVYGHVCSSPADVSLSKTLKPSLLWQPVTQPSSTASCVQHQYQLLLNEVILHTDSKYVISGREVFLPAGFTGHVT